MNLIRTSILYFPDNSSITYYIYQLLDTYLRVTDDPNVCKYFITPYSLDTFINQLTQLKPLEIINVMYNMENRDLGVFFSCIESCDEWMQIDFNQKKFIMPSKDQMQISINFS